MQQGAVNLSGTTHDDVDTMGDVSTVYPPPPSSKGRKAKSLAYLASEFVKLNQEDETIDVMYAAGMLGVEKRRIYDITNALIGANVLQKQGKSSYHWIGGSVSTVSDEEQRAVSSKRDLLEKQCQELDKVIEEFSSYLEDTYYNNPSVVLTTDELVNSCQKSNPNPNQTIIAICAPPGTDVYVTNNRDGRDNEIFLSSSGGEIRTYLLPSTTESPQVPSGSQGLTGPMASVGAMSPPYTPKLNPSELSGVSTPLDFGLSELDSMQM
ncbi:uncharacterized protein [Blastocystis hominis]|uniref:E2F/DP family winged-helix DNA-binding domain-containing protein n=1 Tax=Blastocystis hominis TaxID=12968 RepID=D8M6T0_BLAHO|nr:uncharacterized protein [Blastocystis hominis]CBK23498.2 unnamed protein product [Blastocystis hominis]|eukprot:XP_012897546.1 uncharacterized protein [Blastocystis hominis]